MRCVSPKVGEKQFYCTQLMIIEEVWEIDNTGRALLKKAI
jgi:hypothetical protein